MLSKLVRVVLLQLVHFLVFLWEYFSAVFWRPKRLFLRKTDENDLQFLVNNTSLLKRKPCHLIFIYQEENISCQDIANIIIWSLVSGIPFISFYDRAGVLVKNEANIFSKVEKKKFGVPGCIKWAKQPQLNGFSNGCKPFITTVNMFCENDGKNKIANCVKDILENNPARKKSDNFTAEEIDKSLQQYYSNILDPEVAVYFGLSCKTQGLLPWHVRLTEFIPIQCVDTVTVEDYLNVLLKYSKCDQRFGK